MAANSIPLHCNICPKRPNFSDVSHLLTHIASKGHLSNYYKVKVRSSSEDPSRRLIEAYDRWYAEWNVEELMSERMNQKDKRRSRARSNARPTPAPRIDAPIPRPARPRAAAASNLLDPRLSEHQTVKIEPPSIASTPTPQPGPVLRQRPFAPHIQYWASGSRASSRSHTNQDFETSSEYSDPSERRRYRYSVDDFCAIEDDPIDATMDDPMAVSESTKLKGVYWPGMDIFDSATPEMRRKRNQKKDISVIEQLESNSQEVEPTELIFTPQGSFKRQRRISSSVYDDQESSPIKAESPRLTLTRPMLGDIDVNIPRRRQANRPPNFPFLTDSQFDDDNDRPDFGYGHGDRAPRKKRGFEVFHDEEISFAQPAPFNYLTASFHHQPSPSPTPNPTFASYKPLADSFHYENKENVPPSFPMPAFDHCHHQQPAPTFQYHGYAYGLGQDQHAFPYNTQLYADSAFEQPHPEDDDQRTITAPPSPSTG